MVTKLSSAQLQLAVLEKPWVAKAKNRGDELLNIEIPYAFKNQIDHVLDYFQANPDLNISRISVREAIQQSRQWTEQLNKKASDQEDAGGIKIIKKYPDGFKWVDVISKQALDREGKLMKHCVGSYCDEVQGGNTKIFSLRDKKNEPHCTIEVSGNEVHQIKGKANGSVDKKYRDYVIDFLNSKKFGKIYDLQNIENVIQVDDGKVYKSEDAESNPKVKDIMIEILTVLFEPEPTNIGQAFLQNSIFTELRKQGLEYTYEEFWKKYLRDFKGGRKILNSYIRKLTAKQIREFWEKIPSNWI
ncbi:MAG: PcfJ domain-containing protein [Candidatus Shapirobacteria bacterium]